MGGPGYVGNEQGSDTLAPKANEEAVAARGGAKDQRTTPGQANQITAAQMGAHDGFVPPSKVDLGDQIVGSQTFHEALLFNTEAGDASVTAQVEGNPAVQVVSVPQRIRSTSAGFDPDSAIRLVFSPTARGKVGGALHVTLTWAEGGHAPAEVRIPIQGGAHADGSLTLNDEAAEEKQQEQLKQDAAYRATEPQRAKAEDDKRWKEQKVYGTTFARRELDAATEAAQRALAGLDHIRWLGADAAEKEAVQYSAKQPPHEQSLLAELAQAGLDIATAGLAGWVAKKLEGPIERILTTSVMAHEGIDDAVAATKSVPTKQLVSLFTDSIKQTVKEGAKALESKHGTDKNDPNHTQDSPAAFSEDPLIAFFGTEKASLDLDSTNEATTIANRARNELEPLLDKEPRKAVDAMNAIASGFTTAIADKEKGAAVQQGQASAMHWIRYVAQTSLGGVTSSDARATGKRSDPNETTLTNIDGANAAPTAHGAPSHESGLVDVEFAASAAHPEIPATIKHVYVKGISKLIAKRLATHSLLDAGVAVRGHGVPSDGNAVMPVTVVRDEAGNLTYTDNTIPAGLTGAGWLARKGGSLHPSRDAELRGSRKLMEEDLMAFKIDPDLIDSDSVG